MNKPNSFNSQSVIVIDDHILFREGLVNFLNTTSDFRVVGQAGTVGEGVKKAFHHKPNIILMDFSLPDGTGLDATRGILDKMPNSRIIFLTINETNKSLLEAIRLGAMGYLLKNVSGASFIASLRVLSQGKLAKNII